MSLDLPVAERGKESGPGRDRERAHDVVERLEVGPANQLRGPGVSPASAGGRIIIPGCGGAQGVPPVRHADVRCRTAWQPALLIKAHLGVSAPGPCSAAPVWKVVYQFRAVRRIRMWRAGATASREGNVK